MPATNVSKLIYEVIWDDSDASKKADAWDRKMQDAQKTASAFPAIFADMAKDLLDFAVDAGKNFAQYEDTLSHARRTMGLTREDTLDLGRSLMDLSTDFGDLGLKAGVSANELAKIAGQLGQLGFSVQGNQAQFENLVVTIAKVGTAFGMASQKAAESLGILKNLYDLPVENIENAASSIAYLGNTTVATTGQIMNIMTRMGGIAGLLGVTAQEAAGLAATLREAGVRAQVAGTSMSQIFAKMSSDVDKFGEVLAKGGVSGEMLRMAIESGKATDALKMVLQGIKQIEATEGKIAAAQALKDLGLSGVRVQQTLLALSNNMGNLNENLAASEKAFRENEAVNQAYQAAIDNTSKKWEQFQNLLDVIVKIIGEDLSLVFGDFLDNYLIPFTERVKDWLETSKGAEAIFGKTGIIAQGFEWLGKLMEDNEEVIFEWADALDEAIPQAIEYLKERFKDFFEWIKTDIPELNKAWEKTIQAIKDVDAAIQSIQNAWVIFVDTVKGSLQTLENIGKPLQPLFEGIARMTEETDRMNQTYGSDMRDMGRAINIAEDAMNGLLLTTEKANEAGKKMADDWVYNSYLPDIVNSLEDVYDTGHNTFSNLEKDVKETGVVFERDFNKEALTNSEAALRQIYRTGSMTFSNIAREVNEADQVFQRTTGNAIAGWEGTGYVIAETAERVRLNYVSALKEAGEQTEALNELMAQTIDLGAGLWDQVQQIENVAGQYVEQAMAGNAATLSQGGLPPNLALSGFGRFSPRGTVGTGAGTGINTFLNNQSQHQQQQTQAQNLQVNLIMDNQQVATMSAVLDDNKQQQNRRSFGGSSTGFGSSGRGF